MWACWISQTLALISALVVHSAASYNQLDVLEWLLCEEEHAQEVDVNDNAPVSAHLTRFVTRNVTSRNPNCAIDYVSGITITDQATGNPSTELDYWFDDVNN